MRFLLAYREKVKGFHKFVWYEKNIKDCIDRVVYSVLLSYRVVNTYYFYSSGGYGLFPSGGYHVVATVFPAFVV